MVHASMRAIGPVRGRVEGLIQTLLRKVGLQGTLMAYVDFEPTKAYPFFCVHHSPACRKYGIVAETIRSWHNARRSGNPGASVASIGKLAQWLCEDHPLNFGYGEKSPFAKLVEAQGKVLVLGADLDKITLLYHAQSLAKLTGKRVVHRVDQVLENDNIVNRHIVEFDTRHPVVGNMPDHYPGKVTRAFLQTGLATSGNVGAARSFLFSARDFVEFATDKMEREYGYRYLPAAL